MVSGNNHGKVDMWKRRKGITVLGATVVLVAGCGGQGGHQEPLRSNRQSNEARQTSGVTFASPRELNDAHTRAAGTQALLPPPHPRAKEAPEDGRLQAERMFLDNDNAALLGDQAEVVLASEDFDAFVQRLGEEMATDRDAADLARLYGDEITRQLSQATALGELACGTSVCIGSVRDSDAGQGGEAWADTFSRSPDTPHSSFIYAQVPLGGRNVETRFIIGSDPAYAGISFRAPKRGGD
jgi:hypothetical protein